MIEVLISLLLLGVGALGYVAMTVTASKMTTGSFAYTQATALASDLIERININYPGVATTAYTVANAPYYNSAPATYSNACEVNNCTTGAAMAAYDLAQVEYEANEFLPNGLVAVRIPASNNNHVQVLVSWGSTTPTVGTGANDCVSAQNTSSATQAPGLTYNAAATCVLMESTYQ